MLSEEELIEGCIAGDRTAQKQLYERYSPSFFALCLRYMPSREEAEDVLIMGFTAIFEKMDTFREEGSFEGWMKKVMIHTAVSTIRANSAHYSLENEEKVLNDAGVSMLHNVTYSAINMRDIMNQIRQLSDGSRTVFNLYEIEGYSYEEIANILNISIETVRSQLARARKKKKKRLRDYRI
jgi:RNA polymerase sigma-70 factor (ECF subfamily)